MSRPDPLAEPEDWAASREHPGSRWSSQVRTPELGPRGEMITEDVICDICTNEEPTMFGTPRGRRCELPLDVQLWVGCGNEHVGPVDVCRHHRAHVLAILNGGAVTCEFCAKAGHDVPARVVRVVELGDGDAIAQSALDAVWGQS